MRQAIFAVIFGATVICTLPVKAAPCEPGVLFVDYNQTADCVDQDGECWESAFRYLQDAFAVAQENDVIRVSQGIFYPDESCADPNTDNRVDSFVLVQGVIIRGGYEGSASLTPDEQNLDPSLTILSGDIQQDDTPAGLLQTERENNSYNVVGNRHGVRKKLQC
ncbi:MAG: hypothetical protein IPK83_12055 [Planctomycetes bacterium]|nr:hypothetical protein [Planctomycetota bacterium]